MRFKRTRRQVQSPINRITGKPSENRSESLHGSAPRPESRQQSQFNYNFRQWFRVKWMGALRERLRLSIRISPLRHWARAFVRSALANQLKPLRQITQLRRTTTTEAHIAKWLFCGSVLRMSDKGVVKHARYHLTSLKICNSSKIINNEDVSDRHWAFSLSLFSGWRGGKATFSSALSVASAPQSDPLELSNFWCRRFGGTVYVCACAKQRQKTDGSCEN